MKILVMLFILMQMCNRENISQGDTYWLFLTVFEQVL